MENVRCTNCGGSSFQRQGITLVCDYCGSVYRSSTTSPAVVSTAMGIEGLLSRADAYWSLGQKNKAKDLYRRVLELDAKNVVARQRLR